LAAGSNPLLGHNIICWPFASEQVPASDGSAYQEYALTQKGRDLFPAIVALRQWGEGHFLSRGENRLQVLDKRRWKTL